MRKDLFDELIERGRKAPSRAFSAEEILRGQHPDVATLRAHFKLSQSKFAALLGISVDTLQNWEQKRRRPEGPAKVLLRIAATHLEALLSVASARPRRRIRHSAA
ncbi:MAG: helix-turn-helix domain-containing protein [Gemmatimonadetes bacterium]|nr:helix-turn-helix domain-containing protein [Gemmatimonadota bacterium]